jgi:hypothetical protein
MGWVAPTPRRAVESEQLLTGRTVTEDLVRDATKAAVAAATPLAKNAYKVPGLETVLRRTILAAASQGKEAGIRRQEPSGLTLAVLRGASEAKDRYDCADRVPLRPLERRRRRLWRSRPLGERVLPERRVLVSPDRGSGWTR